MTNFIPSKYVKAIMNLNKSGAIGVEFQKKSGEIVKRGGLPKVKCRRVGGERGERQAETLRRNEMFFVDNPDPEKRGFSFYADKVTEIRASGMVINAENAAQAVGALFADRHTV